MPLVLGGLIYRQLHAPTKFLFEGGGAVQGLGFRDPTPKPYFDFTALQSAARVQESIPKTASARVGSFD